MAVRSGGRATPGMSSVLLGIGVGSATVLSLGSAPDPSACEASEDVPRGGYLRRSFIAEAAEAALPAVVNISSAVSKRHVFGVRRRVAHGGVTVASQLGSRSRAAAIDARAWDELAWSADVREITQRGEMTFRKPSPTSEQGTTSESSGHSI